MHALARSVGMLGERLSFPADAVAKLQCQAERASADSAFMAELSRWQRLLPEKEWPASEERDALLSPLGAGAGHAPGNAGPAGAAERLPGAEGGL